MVRSRTRLGVGLAAVIAVGLASREFPSLVPAFLGKYPGDAFWALAVYLGSALLLPRVSTLHLAALALASSCLVEFSQLYQPPWLNAIRDTMVGRLVLGAAFSWPDIAAYAVGVLVGVLLDAAGAYRCAAGNRPASCSAKR